jgi:hypothetical protein
MSHPFFDNVSYPWSRDDARQLHQGLAQAFKPPNAIRQIVQTVIGDDSELQDGAPAAMWRDALNLIAIAGGMRDLCEFLQQDGRVATNAAFQQLVAGVLEATSVTAQRVLSSKVLLLDRKNLREQLDELAARDAAQRVVVVRGGTKTGKSHGFHLFEAAARQNEAEILYLFNPLVSKVQDVIDRLFGKFGARDQIPPSFTTEPAYYNNVCLKLQEVAQEKRQRLWVAIDDLGVDADGAPLLDAEIRVFCDTLVMNARDPGFGQWFRIMLIHYPTNREIPTLWGEDVWGEDTTSEADVNEEHVQAFLTAWASEHGPSLTDAEVQTLAESVIAKADAPPPPGAPVVPRLKRLHAELLATLRDLKERRAQ